MAAAGTLSSILTMKHEYRRTKWRHFKTFKINLLYIYNVKSDIINNKSHDIYLLKSFSTFQILVLS